MLASELREAFPEFAGKVKRGWQVREGDDDPDVKGIPGIWWENKHGKKPNPRAALKQATEDCHGETIPIAVIRDDRKPPFAVLYLRDLLPMIRAHLGLESLNGNSNQGSGREALQKCGGRRIRTLHVTIRVRDGRTIGWIVLCKRGN